MASLPYSRSDRDLRNEFQDNAVTNIPWSYPSRSSTSGWNTGEFVEHGNQMTLNVVHRLLGCSAWGSVLMQRKCRVWILGHAFVECAEKFAEQRPNGNQLGYSSDVVHVRWQGLGGMMWGELVPKLQSMNELYLPPDLLVIHLGEDELGKTTTLELIKSVKKELILVKRLFPKGKLFWTRLMPRKVWKGAMVHAAINCSRQELNREVSLHCQSHDIGIVNHDEIKEELPCMFINDGANLSEMGNELYIKGLSQVVDECMEKWGIVPQKREKPEEDGKNTTDMGFSVGERSYF